MMRNSALVIFVIAYSAGLLGCDGRKEDLDGDGHIDRIKWSGEKCPPYSDSDRPKNGYCYPD